ncbi:hypothetical protein BLOT_012267 [Blomia tropicalis]|nr:hypothetical protein BLOT_012267 [Blomia tropicalis]
MANSSGDYPRLAVTTFKQGQQSVSSNMALNLTEKDRPGMIDMKHSQNMDDAVLCSAVFECDGVQ